MKQILQKIRSGILKQGIIPIISVVVGVLAFLMTSQYLRGKLEDLEKERQEMYKGATKISVVAAAQDIPSGTVLKQDDLGMKEVFEAAVRDDVVTPDDANMILGKKTLFGIKSGGPISWSYIEGGERAGRGLAPIINPGMRAISLSVGGAAAVSGMVQPNDHIDVLGTFYFPSKTVPGEMETVTLTVLQDVTVLATGQTLAKQQLASRRTERATSYSAVTLEVTPREAELLVFAQQMKGRLTLSLRNPGDVSFESDLPEINFEHLQNKLPELNLYRQRTIRHKPNL